ncbi:hypothetical protein IMY05_C4349000300 [Salix suchowensis]|nr:hypothetical protein IMY05_C4349000300 [Salix suchowensis]
MILEFSDARDEEEEEAYMQFLEEREAMAREMLAKVACARLKWGAIVDGRTLEGAFVGIYAHIWTHDAPQVLEAYVAENMDEFSEEDLEIAKVSVTGRKQKERGVGGAAGQANGTVGGQGAGDERGGGGGDNDERAPKKPRKAKVPIIEQLSHELSEQIDNVNMAGYEVVEAIAYLGEDRFRCVYTHVGAVHGKLTEIDLSEALQGYCHKPKNKSFLEEEALARLIVGYGEINMERLNEAFSKVKTAYSCGPKEARKRLIALCHIQSEKERVNESEKVRAVVLCRYE